MLVTACVPAPASVVAGQRRALEGFQGRRHGGGCLGDVQMHRYYIAGLGFLPAILMMLPIGVVAPIFRGRSSTDRSPSSLDLDRRERAGARASWYA